MTDRIRPREHCGDLMPGWVASPRSECVLSPGHQGSHADDRGARWWYDTEDIDWQQRAEQAEAKVADYEQRITWHTTCASCARILDSSIQETERAERAEAERDGAYRERAQLLAWLATLHQEHAVIAPSIDVDEAGWQLLFLTVAGRQLSWHIAPRDADLFEHVEHVEWSDPRAAWDGHTTDEKYQRIAELSRR